MTASWEGREARIGALSEVKFLEQMLVQIESIVRQVVPEAQVAGRIKTYESIAAKARRIDANVSQIHDKVGIRVIVPSTEHCFVVVNNLHIKMDPVMTSYDDYISHPKQNGYRALHTTLRGIDSRVLEVQVRSQKMHRCAESGSARHGLYKSGQLVMACANS